MKHVNKSARSLSFAEQLVSVGLRMLPIAHGKHKILDRAFPSIWNKSGQDLRVAVKGGVITVDPHDLVGWHYAMLRSFDPEVVEVLHKACDPDREEVLLDIGANKCACSLGLASRLSRLRVVAVEPQSTLVGRNLANLGHLCKGRFEYVQAGIGEAEAQLSLVVPRRNSGRASLHMKRVDPSDSIETVQIKTASAIARNSSFGWPTIVKIDVEGHEPHVFKSLTPCLESGRCKAIVFENHATETEAFNCIRRQVEQYGYSVFGIRKSPWKIRLYPALTQLPGTTDYLVLSKDLMSGNDRLTRLIRY